MTNRHKFTNGVIIGDDVGIGTINPNDYHSEANNLVIYEDGYAGITIATGASNTGSLFFADGTSGDALQEGRISYYHGTTNRMDFATNHTTSMTIDNAGNIGIGTVTPNIGSWGSTVLTLESTEVTNIPPVIELSKKATLVDDDLVGIISFLGNDPIEPMGRIVCTADGIDGASNLHFFIGNGTTISNAMTVDSNQNVGIGISAPSNYNDEANNLVIYEAGDAGITIATGTSNQGALDFADGVGVGDNSRGYIKYNHSTDIMSFGSNNQTRININASGLQIAGGIRVSTIIDDDTMATASATTLATSESIKAYVDNQSDAGYVAGDTILAASGTVGAPGFAFNSDSNNGLYLPTTDEIGIVTAGVEVIRIDSSGKVGIGTNSPGDYNDFANNLVIAEGEYTGITIVSESTGWGSIMFADGTEINEAASGYITYKHNVDRMLFGITNALIMNLMADGLKIGDGARISQVLDDDTMATASATTLATSESIKAYVDNQSDAGYIAGDTILVADGTTTAPGLSFNSDTNNGIYLPTTDEIGIVTTGAERLRIDSGGNVGIGTTIPGDYNSIGDRLVIASSTNTGMTIVSGTANVGGLCFADGTTTTDAYEGYIQYDHSTNSMAFGTNHVTAMTINNSGNIICTGSTNIITNTADASDDAALYIGGGGATSSTRGAFVALYGNEEASTGDAYISAGNVSGGEIRFDTGGSQRMVLDDSGKLGIGTVSPNDYHSEANNLVIYEDGHAGITIATGASNTGSLFFADGTSGDALQEGRISYHHGTTNRMDFATNHTTSMTIDNAGNIGIGTVTPSGYYSGANNLVVYEATSAGITIASGVDTTGYLCFADGTTTTDAYEGYIQYDHSTNSMSFGTNHTTTMTINSSGLQIGAGTRIASVIDDDTMATASATTLATSESIKAYVDNQSDAGYIAGDTILAASGTTTAPGLSFNSDTNNGIYLPTTDEIGIVTTGVERLRIDSAGNVGIGTISPSGYYSIANNLVVYDASSTGITIASGTSSFGTLCFADGVTTTDAYEGYIRYHHTPNSMSFGTNHTTALIIDSSGNIGIGTESPSSYSSNANNLVVYEAGNTGLTIVSGATNSGSIYFADGTTTTDAYEGYIIYNHSTSIMQFGTNHTTAMTINNSGGISFNSGVSVNTILDEDTMSSDSATALATQQSIKKYIDDNAGGYSAGDTILAASGTQGAPGLSFNSDTNNGMYLPASDEIGFSTTSAERFRISSTGKFGFGTTVPGDYNDAADRLVIASSTNTGMTIVSGTSNTGSIYFADGTGTDTCREGQIEYNHSTNEMSFMVDESNQSVKFLTITNTGIKSAFGSTIQNFSNDTNLADAASTALTTEYAVKTYVDDNAPTVTTSSSNPSSSPGKEGDIHINTSSDEAFIACGSGSGDWKQITNA